MDAERSALARRKRVPYGRLIWWYENNEQHELALCSISHKWGEWRRVGACLNCGAVFLDAGYADAYPANPLFHLWAYP